jgi:hypothetical protein
MVTKNRSPITHPMYLDAGKPATCEKSAILDDRAHSQ